MPERSSCEAPRPCGSGVIAQIAPDVVTRAMKEYTWSAERQLEFHLSLVGADWFFARSAFPTVAHRGPCLNRGRARQFPGNDLSANPPAQRIGFHGAAAYRCLSVADNPYSYVLRRERGGEARSHAQSLTARDRTLRRAPQSKSDGCRVDLAGTGVAAAFLPKEARFIRESEGNRSRVGKADAETQSQTRVAVRVGWLLFEESTDV